VKECPCVEPLWRSETGRYLLEIAFLEASQLVLGMKTSSPERTKLFSSVEMLQVWKEWLACVEIWLVISLLGLEI